MSDTKIDKLTQKFNDMENKIKQLEKHGKELEKELEKTEANFEKQLEQLKAKGMKVNERAKREPSKFNLFIGKRCKALKKQYGDKSAPEIFSLAIKEWNEKKHNE